MSTATMPLLRFDSHQCVTQRGHTAIASSIATNGATVYTGGASAVPTVCVLLGPAGGRARDSLARTIHERLPRGPDGWRRGRSPRTAAEGPHWGMRSEEHTSELQSQFQLVCRLL